MAEIDQFATWNKLLGLSQQHKTKAGLREAIGTAGIQIIETEPHSGYYRSAAIKDGPFLPVAIWRDDDGTLNVWRAGKSVALERVWPYCVWHPVSYEQYEAVADKGEKWWDEDATVTEQVAEDAVAAREQIGGNSPPAEDEATALKNQIDAAAGVAEKTYAKINSDDEAAQAQSMRSRLLELKGKAEKKHDVEKAPHLEKCQEIDNRWNPMAKFAKAAADKIRAALEDWSDRKREAARVEAAKAAQLAEAQRQAAAAEQAEQADGEEDHNPETGEVIPMTPTPEPISPTFASSPTIKGASGRAARVGVKKVAVIVDQDMVYAAFRAIPEVKEVLQKIAQRFVDNGQEVPGVDVAEKSKVA